MAAGGVVNAPLLLAVPFHRLYIAVSVVVVDDPAPSNGNCDSA